MTGHADLIREARAYWHPKMRPSILGSLKEWGPRCAFCGNGEYRIDGYCSHECSDLHEHVLLILDLADALEAAEKERDEARAENRLLRVEVEELDGLRLSCICYRRLDTPTWWKWARGPHSAKPEAFLDLVEQVSPGPYLELFARRQRLGWETWGNEALEHVTMPGAEHEGVGA